MNKMLLCTLVLMATSTWALPLPQSFDHLIIPYEEAEVQSVDWNNKFGDGEPPIFTSYNLGAYRGGDFLEVPLGASYTVTTGEQKLKRGTVVDEKSNTNKKPFSLTWSPGTRPGIVL